MMHLNADISSALQLLEDIKQTVDNIGDPKLQLNTSQDLNLLISVLENPVFRSIVTVQDSVSELNQQLSQHPSILPVDFDITAAGELVLNVPPAGELYDPDYTDDYPPGRDFDEQRVPSAPISPSSPQVPLLSNTDNQLLLVNSPKLNSRLCNSEVCKSVYIDVLYLINCFICSHLEFCKIILDLLPPMMILFIVLLQLVVIIQKLNQIT